ncbi:hypothetical protein ACHAWF_004217 [Thalassiosira exigua]
MLPVWPGGKDFSKTDAFNIRVKVMRMLPTFRESNGDYLLFKSQIAESSLLGGIDDIPDLNDDEAYSLAQSLWLEIEETETNREESLFSFVEYLKLIQSRAKGFAYELVTNQFNKHDNVKKKKLLGVLWQTATMRKNFELFGDYIGLDVMKKGFSSLLWMYMAVAMYDESTKICIGCGRPLDTVKEVAGDKFFEEELIHSFGFVNARYVTDRWHLLDSGLRNHFGKYCYELIKAHLKAMIFAPTEGSFEEAAQAARDLLRNQNSRRGDDEHSLEAFIGQKRTYAEHELRLIPVNRGLRGSAMSEQNHSSVLVHLNDGDKDHKLSSHHPISIIRDLLKRQNRHVKRTNALLFGYEQKMRVIRADLQSETQVESVRDLLHAANELGFPSFARYKAARVKADTELSKEFEFDPTTLSNVIKIKSMTSPEAIVREFRSEHDRCSCHGRLAEEDMCEHGILAHGGYRSDFFLPRHKHRSRVTGSLTGWEELTENTDAIMGYDGSLEPISVGSPDEIKDNHPQDYGSSPLEEPPIGYLPDHNPTVRPPLTKKIQNILTATSAAYSSFSDEAKFELADLAMKMEEVVTRNSRVQILTSSSQHYTVDVPSAIDRKREPTKRMRPTHELVSVAVTNKRNAKISRLELDQTIESKDHVVNVTGESKYTRGCTFCKQNHIKSNCHVKDSIKKNLLNMNSQLLIPTSRLVCVNA